MPVLESNPSQGFKKWNKDQIYDGTEPAPDKVVYVPLVGDEVTDWNVGILRVSAVINRVAVLDLMQRFSQASTIEPGNGSLITAFSMYQPSAATKIFIDKSELPYRLDIDSRYAAKGQEPVEIKLFLGYENIFGENAQVISEFYTSDGTFQGANVPLVPSTNDPNTKTVPPFHTSHNLSNNDVVTAVGYRDDGGAVSTQSFLVVEAGTIRRGDVAENFITGIHLESSLISVDRPDTIINNAGTSINTTLLEAYLDYANGEKVKVPIDGSKCALLGVNHFDTSRIGNPTEVTLCYYPSATEPHIAGMGGSTNHLSRTYKLMNRLVESAFALKLWPVFTYHQPAIGYTIKWYITNLEGDLEVEVTDLVDMRKTDGSEFSGIDYGVVQNLVLSLNMADVAAVAYPDHIHTQRIEITLAIPGTNGWSPWIIDYIGEGGAEYGIDTHVSVTNLNGGLIDVSCGAEILESWLRKIYGPSAPLFDPSVSLSAPTPTHFRLEYDDYSTEHPVADFNTHIAKHSMAPAFADNQTLNLVWLLKDGVDTFTLAMSPMLIRLDL